MSASTWPPELVLSTSPVTAALVPAAARATAPAAGAPVPPGAPESAPANGPPRARRWAVATQWLIGAALVLAAGLAWFTVDRLGLRLHDTGAQVDAATLRFGRFWVLHDAALEATLAVKWDLAAAAPAAASGRLGADGERLEQAASALQAEIGRPGPLMLSQGAPWSEASAALAESLRAESGAPGHALAPVRAQAALAGLARLAQEARQRQAMGGTLLDEVRAVRREVLFAFSAIGAMLVLLVALAAQWGVLARRERASRRRAQQLAALAEAERARAETVARDKARFLGMLSHELLTPLQSIWSTMDVIESRGRVDATDPAFTRLKESTRSLRGRISDLVDFAKMSSGRLETRVRGFQLDKLVDTALRDVEEALAARNLDVHWEAGPELAQRIYSDPARLRQVIDNLLTNAIKYTERGGISIHAELLRAQGLLRVVIADTGVGIEPDELPRLFEPFYRSPHTAAMAEGSGLGLAVVRSLVDLMGGSIDVESRVGQGTSVTVDVPITEGGDGPADAPPRLDLRLPVLVVDDSRDARCAIADVIRSLGIEVVEATDGATGLATAAQRDFQAIFLDMQMPDLTGYEVARRLRKPGERQHQAFLVLISACNVLDDATVESVFDARIDKPASRADLVGVLARAARLRA